MGFQIIGIKQFQEFGSTLAKSALPVGDGLLPVGIFSSDNAFICIMVKEKKCFPLQA